MSIKNALLEGIHKTFRTFKYIFGVYLFNLFIAFILGTLLVSVLQGSIGKSMAAENLRKGFDGLWYQSFSATATGLARSFNPSVVGIGAVFDGLDKFLSGTLFNLPPIFLWLAAGYILLWIFVTPGLIYKFQSEAPKSFVQVGGEFFFRFLMLFIFSGILYFLTFKFIGAGLQSWIKEATRQTIDERKVLVLVLFGYLITWTVVYLINITFDYSKIIVVKHDLRWVIAAPFRAIGFILSHPGKTLGLYLLLTLIWIILFFLYWIVVPGAGQSTWVAVWITFIIGQLYILIRILLRATYFSSQLSLYEKASLVEEGGK